MNALETTLAFLCSSAGEDGGGVITFQFEQRQGQLCQLSRTPSEYAYYVARHPEQPILYTTNWANGGTVTAYRIDTDSGDLTQLNQQSSCGAHPCYVSVDDTSSYAFVANYTGGSVAMLPIRSDGRLGPVTDITPREGSSVNPDRQAAPHPHAVVPGPQSRYVYVPDLGADQVAIYRVDHSRDCLESITPPPIELSAGAGPRHLAFHPNGRFVYVINELNATITTLEHDSDTGGLTSTSIVDMLPDDYDGHNQCADVQIHPSGQWVYGSNRGHDSVTTFAVDDKSGQLEPIGYESTRGNFPQDLAMDPTGSFLFAGNRRSDELIAFMVDPNNGNLSPIDERYTVPKPSSFLFATF